MRRKGCWTSYQPGFLRVRDGFNICFFASLRAILHLVCLLHRAGSRIILGIFTATTMASCSRSMNINLKYDKDESIVYITPCAKCHETEKKVRYHSHMRLFSHHLSTPYNAWEPRPNARIRISSKRRFHTKRASTTKSKAKKERKCKSTSTSSEQYPPQPSGRQLDRCITAQQCLTTPPRTQPT